MSSRNSRSQTTSSHPYTYTFTVPAVESLQYHYNKWILYLSSIFQLIVYNLLKRPTAFILWPSTIALVLSYPSLYEFYSSPSLIYSNLFDASKYVKSVSITETELNSLPDFTLKSFWVQPSLENNQPFTDGFESNVLTKDFLVELFHIQSIIFKGLDISYLNGNEYDHQNIIIHSPLDYWSNDYEKLINDNNIIKTIQTKGWITPHDLEPLCYIKLFSGIVKTDSLIKTAQALRIIVNYKINSTIDEILNFNLEHFKNKSVNSKIFNDNANEFESNIFEINSTPCSFLEVFLISFIPILGLSYIFISMSNLQNVKSRIGLLLTFFVQSILSIFASSTLASYIFRNSELLQIPLPLILCIPFSLGVENMFRLVLAISKTSEELNLAVRIKNGVTSSGPISTTIVLITCVVLSILGICNNKSCTKQYCLFTLTCVLLNHILEYTFFLSILSIDFRRVELEDLLQRSYPSNQKQDYNNNNNTNTTSKKIRPLYNNGSSFSFSSFDIRPDSYGRSLSYKQILGNVLVKFELPLFNTITSSITVLILATFIIMQWTNGVDVRSKNDQLDIFSNKRGFALELSKLHNYENSHVINIFNPIFITGTSAESQDSILFGTTYCFDIFYFLEFFSFLTFILSASFLTLKLSMEKNASMLSSKKSITSKSLLDSNDSNGSNHSSTSLGAIINHNSLTCFHSKELIKGHFLDIVKLCTSACPFIVSAGMDHKVLVWSPLISPIPTPTQLPVPTKFLPITHVIMSDSGSLITVFSKSGVVKCWSRLSMSWAWTIEVKELEGNTPLDSFFRKKSRFVTGRRRLVSRTTKLEHSKNIKVRTYENCNDETEANKARAKSNQRRRGTVIPLNRTMSIDSNFDHSTDLNQLTLNTSMEFIIILKTGIIVTVDCTAGEVERSVLCDVPVLCAKKLSSPRVNDRIVGIKEDGSLVVSTVVNNKWKSRNVKIDTANYNMGKSLITPAALLRYQEVGQNHMNNDFNTLPPKKKVEFDESSKLLKNVVMETVPFVGMIVRAFSLKAQLVDVQTGTLLKEWPIGQFKPNTFKVFHSEPSHCRFCGCASVGSFSVAYTELESNALIMHTFTIDNRAKNSICLRVERDSRETRCLGFASVTEHQHWLRSVEGWCPTDLNMLMGVRRKGDEGDDNVSGSRTGMFNDSVIQLGIKCVSTGVANKIWSESLDGIRRRNYDGNGKISLHETEYAGNQYPKLSDIWEGWTMSYDGQVKYYEIPNGSDSGLLIKKLGPVYKFGHKSIVVSFGNIMKILYLGNDNLIEEEEPDNESLAPMSQASSSLSFINRRRKLRLKKYDLTHSTNFNDTNVVENSLEIN